MSKLPKAVWEGTLKIAGVELKVCVLDNGLRVIEESSFRAFWDALENGTELDAIEVESVVRFVKGLPVKP